MPNPQNPPQQGGARFRWLGTGLSLRWAIVLGVIVGLLIPSTVGSWITLERRRDGLTQSLNDDLNRQIDTLAISLRKPLWSFDRETTIPLLGSVFSDQRIVSGTVVGLISTGASEIFSSVDHPQRRRGRQIVATRTIDLDGKPVGNVTLEMDTGQMDAELSHDRQGLILTVIGQLFFSLLLILSLLHLRLLVPIRRLMHESERLATRDLAAPFVWTRKDELGTLGASLENTRKALQDVFRELEESNSELAKDIERRIRFEHELQRHRNHLEEIVAHRTSELSIAKDRAEIASKAKSTFLASMSHELRTPLNAILGYTQILKRDKNLSERQLTGLDTVQRSGEHLLMLINDVLDISKIEAGKFELIPSAVQLPVFVQVISDIIRVKAEERSLQFVSEVDEKLPNTVMADEMRLRQVLLNLLGNAVKFSERGRVSLKVRRVADADAQSVLRFEVQDNGVGMNRSQLDTIFQAFEQVGDAKQRSGGTGLGLAISRQLVRLMGGDIFVESELGKGSLFWFEIALPVIDSDHLQQAIPTAADHTVIGYEGPRRKLLITDDVPANRAMLIALLGGLGFDIVEASNGRESLNEMLISQPDLVITDVTMPVMDGLEATRRMRANPVLEKLPTIVVSATFLEQDRVAALEAGANVFMAKPIDQSQLLHEIGTLLNIHWQTEDSAVTQNGSTLVSPGMYELKVLHDLVLDGNIGRIRKRADHLSALDPAYGAFADKLRQLAKEFQVQEIQKLVEKYMRTVPKND
ncbi:MAG: response regulator [Burkholderiales bacterium]|nr:response regulator [Burkholderiales bacterium]